MVKKRIQSANRDCSLAQECKQPEPQEASPKTQQHQFNHDDDKRCKTKKNTVNYHLEHKFWSLEYAAVHDDYDSGPK